MIKLKSATTNDYIYLNPKMIGHIYKSEKDGSTIIGVSSHNTGGFKVKETPEEVANKINSINDPYSSERL